MEACSLKLFEVQIAYDAVDLLELRGAGNVQSPQKHVNLIRRDIYSKVYY